MSALKGPRRSILIRLLFLSAALLLAFAASLGVLYNALQRRQLLRHYAQRMQRDAYVISQNLSELLAPSAYDTLDENRFIVGEENLAPYLALTESLTGCNVYLLDAQHNVTGSFDGVVQQLKRPLLPGYLEQSVALGFMGKTPFVHANIDGELHLTTCMPVMDEQSRVLGVVLLESTLRKLGYTQMPTGAILLMSCVISFALSVPLAFALSRVFTRPISRVQQVALALANGEYDTRTQIHRQDEIGSLAGSMDILAERLEEARRLDEQVHAQQQELFSNISHELRTPVTVIRGSLEALRDGVITGEADVRTSYDQMLRESCWLQRLIQDVLELSRLQNTEYSLAASTFGLAELLGDVAMSARALCESKGVVFLCEEPGEDVSFTGDYARLRQMLLAVADNAVKFTGPGGRVRLWLDGRHSAIGISDEGVGISPDELPHIFDRFHTTRDSSYDGTGLGLSIVQEIARRHGVRIDVQSEPGQGTTFLFLFPREADAHGSL